MNQVIQNITYLNTLEDSIWRNVLETDYQGVDNSFRLREDYIKVIASVSHLVRPVILQVHGWDKVDEIPEVLPDRFKTEIRTIGLLKEFVSKLNRTVILENLRENLETNDLFDLVSSATEPKRALLAILLVSNLNVELLLQLFLISKYERFGYQDYSLIMDLEGIGDPLRQAELKETEERGILGAEIDGDQVNEILESYELSKTTGLNSLCLKVFPFNNELIVFILRESQRGGLRTFAEFIVDMNADLLVLRFSHDFKKMKVRAVETVKEEVYQTIAEEIVKTIDSSLTPRYIKSTFGNSGTVLQRFTQALITEEIANVTLDSLEIIDTPLPGRPTLFFQKTSEHVSLSESLGLQGDNNEFQVLDIITRSKISKIKISFVHNRRSHKFSFKINRAGEINYVFISGQGGGIGKRRLLLDLLNSETDIRILEARE